MPTYLAYRTYPNPFLVNDPVYEIDISPPFGEPHRDTRIAFIGPHLPLTSAGNRVKKGYLASDASLYVSIRLEPQQNPEYQTNPLRFVPLKEEVLEEDRLILGWDELKTYFDDGGDRSGVRTLVLKNATSDDCAPY